MSDIPFTHLHVHSQYSLLDGKASVKGLVNKAIDLGMRGIALTDHGNMFGIKEFFNYVEEVNSKRGDDEKFKPILGCEMYCAADRLTDRKDKNDKGYHLIVLAKNEKGYHNLIKLVSKAWTEGFYYHARTDRYELAEHHEGLIVCSACLGGEVPRHIAEGRLELAEERVRWFKEIFGDDYYIELQRHKTDKPNANVDVYPQQCKVNEVLLQFARKYDIKVVATNDVHFVEEADGEAHDRLICISTQKRFNEPRMHYTKQEWLKSTEQMREIFADIPEAIDNTQEILDKVETYSIDHAPIMPTFDIPESFGTEAQYRETLTERDLFDEFTRDENGNVVMSEADGEKKIAKLGGYDKLYRIKLEADYLAKLTYEKAAERYGDPLPDDVKDAEVMVRDREQILADAQHQAEQIIADAQQQFEQMVSNHAIVQEAQRRANGIVQDAMAKADEEADSCTAYLNDVLGSVEQHLRRVLDDVHQNRVEVNSNAGGNPPQNNAR